MLGSVSLSNIAFRNGELSTVLPSSTSAAEVLDASQEACSDYVAHLQMHMALQARNLVPSITHSSDRRESLLHQTQADLEKMLSRRGF